MAAALIFLCQYQCVLCIHAALGGGWIAAFQFPIISTDAVFIRISINFPSTSFPISMILDTFIPLLAFQRGAGEEKVKRYNFLLLFLLRLKLFCMIGHLLSAFLIQGGAQCVSLYYDVCWCQDGDSPLGETKH